ncbi:nucleotidyl transferase AbiEii/AbiGii toxin family protein [bacterium]|nr:MAG: nucleotidyl transferase AbiEii/AbiGii toxin family protein [bacterium]
MFSKEYLLKLSKDTGFLPEGLQKQMTLLDLLREISRHPLLRTKFALKGGTALNLFWFPLPRLSVDIDLNYIASADRETMLTDRPVLEKELKKLIESKSIAVQFAPADEHAGAKWRLRAPSAFGGSVTLELDLNYLMRVPIGSISSKQPYPLDEDYSFSFNSVSFEELFGGKVAALLERSAARDLYDVAMLSQAAVDHDLAAVRRAHILIGVTSRKDWRSVDLHTIDAIDQKMIADELTPVLRQDEAPNLDSMKSKARKILDQILNRTEKEKEFLDIFLDKGVYEPSLLFDNPGQAEALRAHPAVLWKLENHRKHFGLEKT